MSLIAPFEAPSQLPEDSEYVFPRATPLVDMTDAERAEYWRREAKKQQQKFTAACAYIRQFIDRDFHTQSKGSTHD